MTIRNRFHTTLLRGGRKEVATSEEYKPAPTSLFFETNNCTRRNKNLILLLLLTSISLVVYYYYSYYCADDSSSTNYHLSNKNSKHPTTLTTRSLSSNNIRGVAEKEHSTNNKNVDDRQSTRNNHLKSKKQTRPSSSFQSCAQMIEYLSSSNNNNNNNSNSNSDKLLEFQNHPAIQCLRQTTPSLNNLYYPSDAVSHFQEIHQTLNEFLIKDGDGGSNNNNKHGYAGYNGPRIENYWITSFYEQYEVSINNGTTCIPDLYGPFIPLFIPWVDLYLSFRNLRRYRKFIQKVTSLLRNDVAYITVSQNAEGLLIDNLKNDIQNLLVLSGGGYGHVPIPLLNQIEPLYDKLPPTQNRSSVLNYVGSLVNAPHNLRTRMNETLNDMNQTITTLTTATTVTTIFNSILSQMLFFNNKESPSSADNKQQQQQPHHHRNELHPTKLYQYAYGDHWRSIMADSLFSIVPRGYGRTAFHLMETFQMGLIPTQIYSDIPWIPYSNLLLGDNDDVGPLAYATNLENLPTLVKDTLLPMLLEESSTADNNNNGNNMNIIERKEARIVSLRESHFVPTGIMAQIKAFMSLDIEVHKTTDLVCQTLPETIRDG